MTTVAAFVFARGGSKGLPKKNVLKIKGIPLLGHSINMAKSIPEVHAVYVSTDCHEIASIAREFGAIVIMRPSELATDLSPEWLSWQHAINVVNSQHVPFDCFLSLPTTSPLRSRKDVQNCLGAMQSDVDMVIAVTPAQRNPWFNMVMFEADQQVSLVAGSGNFGRRQDSPRCYDVTTVAYVAKPDFVLSAKNLWQGRVIGVVVPQERSIDIDSELDFAFARFLMEGSHTLDKTV